MNSRRAKVIAVAIGVILIVVDAALYVSKSRAPQIAPALTNAEEAALQQQIADIIASKNEAGCATLANETYRLACEQILNVPQGGRGNGTQLVPMQIENFSTTSLETLAKQSQGSAKLTPVQLP